MTTTHKNLIVWQLAMEVAVDIYKLTRTFPKSEEFGIVSQMRRSAVSIPSNIAEGYGRSSHKELQHFLDFSMGSASELETQLIICKRVELMSEETADALCFKLLRIIKMLSALISRAKENVTYRQK